MVKIDDIRLYISVPTCFRYFVIKYLRFDALKDQKRFVLGDFVLIKQDHGSCSGRKRSYFRVFLQSMIYEDYSKVELLE